MTEPADALLARASWLVATHPRFVHGLERGGLARWRTRVGPVTAQRVIEIGRSLVRGWAEGIVHELDAEHREPLAWTRAAMQRVRRDLVDPFDLSGDLPQLPRPRERHADALLAGRLLRGTCNCDAFNHLFGLLLTRWGAPELVAIDGHRLVRVDRLGDLPGPVFVDAYARLGPFTLRASDAVPSYAEAVAATNAVRARRVAAGLLPGEAPAPRWRYRLSRRVQRIRPSSGPEAIAEPPLDPVDAPGELVLDPIEAAYLRARVEHLFGDRERARAGYLALARRVEAGAPVWVSAAAQFAAALDG